MAGHSTWFKVKHINGLLDQKRGQLFSKLAIEITVAARMGGGDPDGNPRLRSAILAARVQSTPSDTIERANRRGTSEGVAAAETTANALPPAQVLRLIQAPGNKDGVQNAKSNFNAPKELLIKVR